MSIQTAKLTASSKMLAWSILCTSTPESGDYWVIDHRIFDPYGDGKSKLDHVRDKLTDPLPTSSSPSLRRLWKPVRGTKDLMLFIEFFGEIYDGPIRDNGLVDDSNATSPYKVERALHWSAQDLIDRVFIKIKGFPKHDTVKLFQVLVSTNRTDWIREKRSGAKFPGRDT